MAVFEESTRERETYRLCAHTRLRVHETGRPSLQRSVIRVRQPVNSSAGHVSVSDTREEKPVAKSSSHSALKNRLRKRERGREQEGKK